MRWTLLECGELTAPQLTLFGEPPPAGSGLAEVAGKLAGRYGGEPFSGKWLDLHMLALLGGRERTAAEYAVLFNAAGFELTRVVPTTAGPSVVEAVPV